MTGVVLNVQRYSIHDGPGIRTVVFLKGCPLRCVWCCNPESQRPEPEVEIVETLCERSGRCVPTCSRAAIVGDASSGRAPTIDRECCDACGLCADVCPSGALRRLGTRRSVDDVFAEVLRDAAVYRKSGGGVTISGGEPMVQARFVHDLLQACYRRHIATAIETTAYVSWSLLEEILPFTDLFLLDVKHMDAQTHRRLTGIGNERILENAERLARAGASIIVRVPLIPDCNGDDENLEAVAAFAVRLHALEVHLMPFHQLGKAKYHRLGLEYRLVNVHALRDTADGAGTIRRAEDIMAREGLKVFVGG